MRLQAGLGGGGFAGGPPAGLATSRRGPGGLLDTSQPSADLVVALQQNASHHRWVAATIGSNNAAGLQLAADEPVMSIGGFNGTDPTPTLAQFQLWVRAGAIHYFVAGGGVGGPSGGSSTGSAITAWVESNYMPTTIGGMTVYDCPETEPAAARPGGGFALTSLAGNRKRPRRPSPAAVALRCCRPRQP